MGLACGIATAALVAQAPPTFRADTHLVEVSVVVHDKAGEPVTGLTRDDFSLLEDGKEQPIEMFSVDGRVLIRNGAAAAAGAATEPLAALAAGEISNRLDAGVRAGAVTAILFDRVNTRIEDQHPAREQIAKFLGQIRPDDRVALYSLEWDRVRVLHDFTNDATSLLRALSWPAAADRAPDDPDLAGWISHTSEAMSALMVQNRASVTLDALVGVAQHLAGVRGRKNLIWVSSGIPWAITDENIPIPVGRAARAVDDANVAIYPVDARGLVGNAGVAPAETMPEVAAMKGKVTSKPIIPERGVAQPVANFEVMKALAANTGGRAFINSNDIKTAIRSAIDDGRMTYVLGYYPSHGKWDGAFRQITVKVKRPGVEVRHRKGYRAFPMSAKVRAQPNDDLIAEAKSPLAATGLGLTARVSPAGAAGRNQPRRHADGPRRSGRHVDLERRRRLERLARAGDRAERGRRPLRQERARQRGRRRAGVALRADHDQGLQLHADGHAGRHRRPDARGAARPVIGRDRIADHSDRRSGFAALKIS